MRRDLKGTLRDARYALPGQLERISRGPQPREAARIGRRLGKHGLASAFGYFPGKLDTPETIAAANLAMADCLQARTGDAYLSVKAPQLSFDLTRLRNIAEAAAASRLSLLFDSHSHKLADPTLALLARLLDAYPETGFALPARWQRSLADARRFRESNARIRIVKGEWTDESGDALDIEANYLQLVSTLAGRSGIVSVATHCPHLAERALTILRDAGTPCELEQLRGLPRRRTMAIARKLAVPVRIYVPFGQGWLPYALDKALARPYLPGWIVRDRFGLADPRELRAAS